MNDIKRMPIRQFGEKYNKNIHQAPIIITKGGKDAFIVLTYSDYAAIQQAFKAPPVEVRPMNDIIANSSIERVNSKPTVFARLKSILNTKII